MGVTGLLQQLKDIQEKTTLSKYKGKTLAVDTYGWLHRGLILCAQDLCTDEPTRGYITSVMKKVDMVRHFGVEPLMVFDGLPLPTKEGTHMERRAKREKARESAQKLLQKGDRKSAWKEFMKAAEVTPEMAKSVMVELDRKHVKYVVAPYEADPQMVYLEKIGIVDGILSEDSDLLVFGCRRLITKLNDYGECIEICRDNLHKIPRMKLDTYTHAQWRLVAILSGCDYTKGIPGVGLKTAFNIVLKIQDLDRIVAFFQSENKTIPPDFLEEAVKANFAFQYQKVFDPAANCLTTLCEIAEDTDVDMLVLELCCGRRLDPAVHIGICSGKINPFSHKPLISREQNLTALRSQSVTIPQNPKLINDKKTTQSAQISQSFTQARSIESYFRVEKPAESAGGSFLKPQNTLKRPNDKTAQLSPSSKKLRRFQNSRGTESSTKCTTISKFFGSSPTTIPPASTLHSYAKPSEADLGVITGDSEVPEESSSPVKMQPDANESDILTDEDDMDVVNSTTSKLMVNSVSLQLQASVATKTESDVDEGYENDVDESPLKPTKIGLQWRANFSCVSQGNDMNIATKAIIRKTDAVKIALEEVPSAEEKCSESLESSLCPQTPEETPISQQQEIIREEATLAKSLQQSFISESEPEYGSSPQRRLPSQPSARLGLLRFAFTGR